MVSDTNLMAGTGPQISAILCGENFRIRGAQDAGHFRRQTPLMHNDRRGIGGPLWKRMQKSHFESKAIFCSIRAACILGLAIFVAGSSAVISGRVLAGGALERYAQSGSANAQKIAAGKNTAALELSLEQALWTALAFEDTAKLHDVIERGADPNKPEKLSLMTPLMAAETEGMAEILLKAGANPNLRDRTGRTAMHHAVKMRQAASVVRLLGKAGADVNARAADLSGSTPLLSAVEHYIEDKDRNETALVIRILSHLGADLDLADAGGRTPLALAAANNQPELIKLLIELGADPEREMADGQTPLDFARAANAEDAIQALAAAPSKQPPAN